VLQAVGRDALINGVLTAAQQPIVAHNMAENGEQLGLGEAAGNVVAGTVLGGVLGGTIHLARRISRRRCSRSCPKASSAVGRAGCASAKTAAA
jgi:hypothetical protein